MEEDWGDEDSLLWNPHFELRSCAEYRGGGGSGILIAPHWSAQALFGRLRPLSSRLVKLQPDEDGSSLLQEERSLNSEWGLVLAKVAWLRTGRKVSAILSSF